MSAPGRGVARAWVTLEEVDSTNAEAMRRAVAGAIGPLYVRADRQTAGRGRSGRAWSAPDGNLALSRLGPLDCAPQVVPQLSLVAGLAVHRACAGLLGGTDAGRRLKLKWPNDLLLDGGKLAGVLVEATTVGGQRVAVIGIGVNLAVAPAVPGRRTSALVDAAAGESAVAPAAAAERVADALDEALDEWDEGRGFGRLREAWLAAAIALGTAMTIETPQGRVAGSFGGLGEGGALLLRTEAGRLQSFAYGDVTLASEQEMS